MGDDRRRVAGVAVLVTASVVLLVGLWTGEQPGAAEEPEVAPPSHPALFFDEKLFYESVATAASTAKPRGEVAGGIIPHHWLGGHLITSFLQGLAADDPPETVVLVGPNHQNAGRARVLTSHLPWSTPFGLVEPDEAWIDGLTDAGLAGLEPPVLTTEHSVAGIMPAIRYYLPEARVAPLILQGELSPVEARRLGEALAARLDENTVVIAAVDFSHYLVSRETARYDAITLDVLRTFDSERVFTFDNNYLDSPPSIAVLMAAMLGAGAEEFVLLENTDSGTLTQDELIATTSYISGYYPAR